MHSDALNPAGRLQLVLDAIMDRAAFLLDPNGTVASWNAGAQRIMGFTADDMIGAPVARCFTPEDRERDEPQRMLLLARQNGEYEQETWRLRKDGSRFRAHVVVRPVHGDNRELVGFTHIAREIAGPGIATAESDRYVRMLVQGIVDYAIFMLDGDGRVTTWNAGAERIKGYRPEEIIGRHFSVFYGEEDRRAGVPQQSLEKAARDGRIEMEGWRIRKDGTRFFASVVIDAIRNERGELVGFAKITRDLTDRLVARAALRESEERFQLLVQSVTDYAIYMLDPQGRITNWNAGGERIKGYEAAEAVGQHFSLFYTEEDRRAGLPQTALAIATRDGKFEGEGWRVRKDGTRFFANVVIDAIRDANGRLIGFAKITRDITERRDTEEKLEATRAAFLQAQKMEALGQLTGGVAHDFNNLLTVVLNNADLLAAPGFDDRGRARLIDGIRHAATRGATLVQQLLAYARRQPLNPKPHRLNAVVGAFEAVLRRACGARSDLRLDLTAAVTTAEIDVAQFEAALLNLAVNARDAMPDGGELTLATAVAEIDAARGAGMEGLKPGRYVVVSVSDTGSGMAPEIARRAFEPFFTTKEPGKGSGLGLSQVFGFVKQSRGHIEIRSNVGVGTNVTLYLPAAAETGQDEDEDRTTAARRVGCGTVLVVEDDPDVLDATIAALKSLGYDILTADDGPAALRVLRRDDTVDVLFSDVVMPRGMNGVELAREALRLRPGLKVLLASGYPTATFAREHQPADAFAFIAKPYRREELAERLLRVRDGVH